MPVIAIVVALLIMIPATLAGIFSGLAQCLSHRPDLATAVEHANALIATLGPFGSGMLLAASSLFTLVVLTLAALTLFDRGG